MPEAETAPTPAKRGRGRPKKAASTASLAEGPAAEAPAAGQAAEATPPKAGKRGRPKKAAKEEAPAAESPAKEQQADGDGATEAPEPKRAKRAAAPKRDKNSPLPRSLTPRELEPPTGSRVLRLLSVNVAGLRAVLNGDKAKLLRALVDQETPDVLCINEHKLKEEDVAAAEEQLKELLPKEYATAHWACSTAKKGYSGVAMLLRHAPDGQAGAIREPAAAAVAQGMGPEHEEDPIISQEGRVLTLELPELVVVATYVPNSGADLQRLEYRVDREAKQCWDRALTGYVRGLQEAKSKPVVLLGDMNCCQGVRDIWNMHDRPDFPEGLAQKPLEEQYTGLTSLKKFAGLTPEERGSFPRMLEEAGLVDTFRRLHPEASGVFSYFSTRIVQNRPMNKGLRLDYVLASSSLCAHLRPRTAGEAPPAEKNPGEEAPPAPRVLDSFILDEQELIADHAAVGCHVLLPPP
uniref:DNA-(apurinic or apyrimidinic site) endonuclease n=1 Tax=Lingulaulax polyedra TaxID=160621 RepID=A0A516AFX8_LINPO|nr:DNA-(apurinic or apyrimidinic site) lyase [Lingulodinium polyedra]